MLAEAATEEVTDGVTLKSCASDGVGDRLKPVVADAELDGDGDGDVVTDGDGDDVWVTAAVGDRAGVVLRPTVGDTDVDGGSEALTDADAVIDRVGDAGTAAHAAFAHANVCVQLAVSGTLASTSADAPSSSSVCVAARAWHALQARSSARLVKTTDCSAVAAASVTCQNSLADQPADA